MKFKINRSIVNSVWLFSIWPIFLFVSQKLLVVIHLFNIRFNAHRRITFFAAVVLFFLVIVMSIITLFFGEFNSYSIRHFSSFVVFLVYATLISGVLTIERYSNHMLRLISLINFFSLILIHFVYFYELELPGVRGLNFIRGTDNEIHRFYVETSPVFLISSFGLIKSKTVRIIFILLTLSYFVWISKNTFLSLLFFSLLIYRYFKYFRLYQLFVVGLAVFFFSVLGILNWNSFFRADLLLSIVFKLEQLTAILGKISWNNLFCGEGFGFYIADFATDLDQPYQLEMQLPMLFLQIGILNCLALIVGMYFIFKSVKTRYPLLTTGLFFSVGLVNPWMFLPVWFISSLYFFKKNSQT